MPFSGLMILFAILMFGLALAIPASRAIQEAEMRDRIAAFGGTTENGESESSGEAASDPSELPAIAELADDEDEDDPEQEPSSGPGPNPKTLHDSVQSNDRATSISGLQANAAIENEPEENKPPKPTHLRIPAVNIDTEIVQVGYEVQEVEGQRVREWEVASYAAGHHKTSARPGEKGNMVITGHNDWEGEVFRTLEHIEIGNEVSVSTENGDYTYVVEEVHMRREIGVSMEERLATGQFLANMPDERLTLVTCWPYGINDHRVIVVAKPVDG